MRATNRRCRSTGRDRRRRRWRAATRSLVSERLGASDSPCSALAAMQSKTVRRSCQPMPGADRLAAGAVPDDRAGPLVGDPDGDGWRARRRARSATASTTAVAIAAASNSTSPGNGVSGGIDRASMATMSRRSSTRAARIVVVPTSMTRMAVTTIVPVRCSGAFPRPPNVGAVRAPRRRGRRTTRT